MTKTTLQLDQYACLWRRWGREEVKVPERAITDFTGFLVHRCVPWHNLHHCQYESRKRKKAFRDVGHSYGIGRTRSSLTVGMGAMSDADFLRASIMPVIAAMVCNEFRCV